MRSKCISVGLLLVAETFVMNLWFASAAGPAGDGAGSRSSAGATSPHDQRRSGRFCRWGAGRQGRDEQADQQAAVPYAPSDQAVHRSQIALAAKATGRRSGPCYGSCRRLRRKATTSTWSFYRLPLSTRPRQIERRSADEGLASPMWIRTRRTRTIS